MDQCGCADPRYPYPVNSTVDVCSLSGENESKNFIVFGHTLLASGRNDPDSGPHHNVSDVAM